MDFPTGPELESEIYCPGMLLELVPDSRCAIGQEAWDPWKNMGCPVRLDLISPQGCQFQAQWRHFFTDKENPTPCERVPAQRP